MREWKERIEGSLRAAGHNVDPDVLEELAQHTAAAYESARADGLEPDDALTRVAGLIDGWTADGARLTRRRGGRVVLDPPSTAAPLAGLMHDLRYAWRSSWRRPGPALVAALTMALGIGATTTLFSVVQGVLLKPLPVSEPERLIRLGESREGATRSFPGVLTNGSYLAWTSAPATTIEGIGAYAPSTMTLTGAGDPQRVRVIAATASLLRVFRVVPVQGALFTDADEAASNLALISYAFWQRQFGAATDATGRTLSLDGKTYTVIGVLQDGLAFPSPDIAVWIPFQVRPSRTAEGGSTVQLLRAVARLANGATVEQASEEATARARAAEAPGLALVAMFGSKGTPRIVAERLLDAVTADVRDALWVLLAAVALLLITATANIASVQLARAASRRRELAIRVSLGASGRRIARQLILESLAIAVVGGAAGILLAYGLHNALPTLLPADFPRVHDIALDARVLGFAVVLTAGAGVVCGLVPALQMRRLSPRSGMVEDAGATGVAFNRSATARIRALIMVGQVAAACLLLVGAAVLGRTFLAMLDADRGYEPSNVLTARIASPARMFTAERRTALLSQTLERLRAHPDVLFAGSTNVLPLTGVDAMMALNLPPSDGASEPRQVQTGIRTVSPGYFESLGIRVLDGRVFSDRDTRTSAPVFVANRAFAKKYLEGVPLGRRVPLNLYEGMPDWELIGIVDDIRTRPSLTEDPGPEIFQSYLQTPNGANGEPTVVVRTRNAPNALIDPLRQIVSGEDPRAALESVMTMEDRIVGSLARPRLYAVVLLGFAAFALAIAAVGLFGVLSYGVTQRSKELGVRAALGAQQRQLVGMIVREALVISGAGIAIGLFGATLASRWLAAFVFGVRPIDPVSFAVVAVLLLGISLLACAMPARRAATVDPLTVLKST